MWLLNSGVFATRDSATSKSRYLSFFQSFLFIVVSPLCLPKLFQPTPILRSSLNPYEHSLLNYCHRVLLIFYMIRIRKNWFHFIIPKKFPKIEPVVTGCLHPRNRLILPMFFFEILDSFLKSHKSCLCATKFSSSTRFLCNQNL